MKPLTKAEEQVMRIIWELEKAFLKDIVNKFAEPRPAYTTISTVLRVLVKKEFISYKTYGKIHEYYPLVNRENYYKNNLNGAIKNLFGGSLNKFASYFTEQENLSVQELEEIKDLLEKKIDQLKKKDND